MFPRDGVYNVRVQLTRYAGASFDEIPAFDEVQRLELSLDGTPVHVFELVPAGTARDADTVLDRTAGRSTPTGSFASSAKAGPRTVALAFLNRTPALLENLLEPFQKPVPGGPNGYYTTQKGAYLHSVEISGPYEAHGAGQTPSRERIFVCRPSSPARDETACAKKVLSTLARRAFRRPVAEADIQTLMSFYQEGRSEGNFELGIERAVEGLLVSPEFLYRIEREPSGGVAGPVYRISDLELASRLSFFLWSSIPDDTLLDVASSGKLRTPGVLEQQVRRMLADPRSDALVTNFVGQWLFLRNLPTVLPDPEEGSGLRRGPSPGFPPRNGALRGQRPSRGSQRARSADRELHVRQRAAREALRDPKHSRHAFPASGADRRNRRGLLGQGSMLAITSFPNRTSPVVRGKWILENLLGAPLPPPPPDVPALVEKPNPADEELSMRERDRPAPRQPRVRELPRDDGPARSVAWRISTSSGDGGTSTKRSSRSMRRLCCRTEPGSTARPVSGASS